MRVLFIGSSFITGNDMTGILGELVRSAGQQIEARLVTRDDSDLKFHWYCSEAVPAIDEEGWDYVVLQDHSLQALRLPEALEEFAGLFAERIRVRGGKPVLYMSWPRQHHPEDWDALCERYLQAARGSGSLVAPAGMAWKRVLDEKPDVCLYAPDRNHPNFAGSYLVACTFYATLFGASPEGLSSELAHSPGVKTVIEPGLAAGFQAAAWATVQGLEKDFRGDCR
jgi:hypothetical protein